MTNHQSLFKNSKEINKQPCTLTGDIPTWLSGSLYRNGPALFDLENQSVNHWFDGMGMIHHFDISGGKVYYQSKFVQSSAYKSAKKNQQLSYREFATDPCVSLFRRFFTPFSPSFTTNTCVNISKIGDHLVSLTETPQPIIFDKDTVETRSDFKFDDEYSCNLNTAHPHIDAEQQRPINVAIRMGAQSYYEVFTIHNQSRHVIASIPVKKPSYQHSFGITENYIIIMDTPFKVSPLGMLVSTRPFIEQFKWHDCPTTFIVIDKHKGEQIASFKAPPCFMFHHINAYEENESIIFDAITFEDADIISKLYVSNCRSDDPQFPTSRWSRYVMNRRTMTCDTQHRMIGKTCEMPTIHYAAKNTQSYEYFYALNKCEEPFFTHLIKHHISTDTTMEYHRKGGIPSEPIFVPDPNGHSEDDGILLSVWIDPKQQLTELHGICARTMQCCFIASIPVQSAFSFHGQFFKETGASQ